MNSSLILAWRRHRSEMRSRIAFPPCLVTIRILWVNKIQQWIAKYQQFHCNVKYCQYWLYRPFEAIALVFLHFFFLFFYLLGFIDYQVFKSLITAQAFLSALKWPCLLQISSLAKPDFIIISRCTFSAIKCRFSFLFFSGMTRYNRMKVFFLL